MTMPAMAPPERPLRCSGSSSDEVPAPAGTTSGVEVTVCVWTAPETVTTRTLVTGVAVSVVDGSELALELGAEVEVEVVGATYVDDVDVVLEA